MIEQFFIDVDNSFLSAVCCRTENSKCCFVFVHAYSNWKDEHDFMFSRMATAFMNAGFSSLLFDMRGHGESDGLLEEISYESMIQDINAAVQHAKQNICEYIVLVTVGFSARMGIECGADAYIMLSPIFDMAENLKPLQNYAGLTIEDALSKFPNKTDMESDMERVGMLPRFVGAEMVNAGFYSVPNYVGPEIMEKVLVITNKKADYSLLRNSESVEISEGGVMFRSPVSIEKIIKASIDFANQL